MDGRRERMVRERARFIEDYEDNIDQARLDLGKLFRIEDYPSKEALQGRFGIRYRITPVPGRRPLHGEARDSDDTDRVKRDIEQARSRNACTMPWATSTGALGEAVERVGERLQRGRRGQAAGVPGFDDREHPRAWSTWCRVSTSSATTTLARLCEQVKDKIAGVEPDSLRPSRSLRPRSPAPA